MYTISFCFSILLYERVIFDTNGTTFLEFLCNKRLCTGPQFHLRLFGVFSVKRTSPTAGNRRRTARHLSLPPHRHSFSSSSSFNKPIPWQDIVCRSSPSFQALPTNSSNFAFASAYRFFAMITLSPFFIVKEYLSILETYSIFTIKLRCER